MAFKTNRRQFIASSAAGIAGATSGNSFAATASHVDSVRGGIGYSQAEWEKTFGPCTEAGDFYMCANPILPKSTLTVMFENDVATFIDMAVPSNGVDSETTEQALRSLTPADSVARASWQLTSNSDLPAGAITDLWSETLGTSMQVAMFDVEGLTSQLAVSLAIPGGGNQFGPASGSVGVTDSIDAWEAVYGKGYDGHGATGHFDATWDIAPWDGVQVLFARLGETETSIEAIQATSAAGVSASEGMAFANNILTQGSEILAGYQGFGLVAGQYGWGASSWQVSETEWSLLYINAAPDESGEFLRVASLLTTHQ